MRKYSDDFPCWKENCTLHSHSSNEKREQAKKFSVNVNSRDQMKKSSSSDD